MNFLQKKTTWANTELIYLKLCIACAYLLIGGYFHNFVKENWKPILVLFIFNLLWSLTLWVKKMKREN